jgi:two-component system phosphate regulon response regulator OmpR
MLVDDDADILSVMTRGLGRHNLAVTGFTDPLMALSDFKANQYDMILLDVMMPGMSGLACQEALGAGSGRQDLLLFGV